jgi:hypothetical protein
MKYEKPEVINVVNAEQLILGTKPGSPNPDNNQQETTGAYEADE